MKRAVIISLAILLALSGGLVYYLQVNNQASQPPVQETTSTAPQKEVLTSQAHDYDYLNEQILSGGPPKDGIPPIDEPKYISVSQADFLNDYDKVFVYETPSTVFLYPQKILVWHEIVNDTVDGEQFSITYCPLTGSTICYLGDENHPNNTYGTSGNLLNSNLVMYDRATDSYIPQILGIGINKDLKSTVIPTKPVHWTNWEYAKELYPDAKVLSSDTGFFRDYNSDPYGSYAPDNDNSYYYIGGPIFPVLNAKGVFQDKKVVVGVKSGDSEVALDPLLIRDEKVYNFTLGDDHVVAVFDQDLKAIRVFNRLYKGQVLEFKPADGGFEDMQGNKWSYKGQSGNDQLEAMVYFDVMWFAWYAYYPETEVIQ